MGKIHEAIQKAEEEYTKSLALKSAVRTREKQSLVQGGKVPMQVNGKSNGFANLKTKIAALHPGKPIRTILFTGITHGIGVTRTAVKFGQTLAEHSGLKVLVIDANLQTPGLHQRLNIKNDIGVSDLLAGNGNNVFNFRNVGQGKLYAFTCGKNCSDGAGNFESERFDKLLQAARDKFDYVILDSPPVTKFSETQTISGKVDGVLLVVEAGKTRRQVARRAKKELEKAGGRLLGVVLNKRKFHIPEWLYKRL